MEEKVIVEVGKDECEHDTQIDYDLGSGEYYVYCDRCYRRWWYQGEKNQKEIKDAWGITELNEEGA